MVRYPAAPMRYDLVCLDAGFTLLMPRRTLADALAGVLEQRGHPVSREELHRAWEVADRWFWQEYHRPHNDTWGSDERIEQTWRDYHTVMLGELGFGDRRHELLDGVAVTDSQVCGFDVDGSSPTVRNCRFDDNGGRGVEDVPFQALPGFTNNTASGNGSLDVITLI